MSNPVLMQVIERRSNWVRDAACSVLSNLKVALVQELEQISACQELENNENILRVLENVDEPDDIRVLTEF